MVNIWQYVFFGYVVISAALFIILFNFNIFTFNYHELCINCQKVEPIPEFKPVFNHSKWIVVTSISNPTEQLKKLVAIPEWKVIVVGDKKTPHNWSYPGSVFLSVEDQMKLGYQITKHLPYNSYTRKMIGYLYAIQNGAQFIYDTDDDNCPTKGEIEFNLEPISSGLIYADLNRTVVNPYSHFGQPQLWPRGFPLEAIAQPPNHTYHLCTFHTPAIQQGLVNGDPDVDAIYRLINKGSNKDITINVTFDARAPPFTLPQGVFAPFNSQNTLFSYQAFWALFLPVTVAFRVTDIWRGYWAQKLLWLTGNYLAFHPPNAIQVRNPHSYLKDFEEEIQMYEESNKLVDFLSQWQCYSPHFYQCVELLTADMVGTNFIKELDLNILKLWLTDLRKVGYEEPIKTSKHLENMCLPTPLFNWINYSPSTTPPNAGFKNLFSMCEEYFPPDLQIKKEIQKYMYSKEQESSFNFENILLVIVFNNPVLQNVRILEILYRDHFPNILFCSQSNSAKELMELINSSPLKWTNNDVTFVNATDLYYGWYGYECAIRAIEMNYNVDGYMFLGEEIFLKPWMLQPFDSSASHIQKDAYGPHSYQNLSNPASAHSQWSSWWGRECGYSGTNNAFQEIESIASNQSDPRNLLFQTFVQNRFSSGVNMSLVSFSMSDFYYIAKQDSWMFAQVLKVFFKHKVFLHIAVPSALSGCRSGNPQTNDGFLGTSVWGGDAKDPFKFFTNDSAYVYPLKLSSLVNDQKFLQRYCLEFVQPYFKNW